MADTVMLKTALDGARVDDAVFTLRPDYRGVLLAVDGLVPGPSDSASEELLQRAEAAVRQQLRDQPVEELPHIAAWREAYRAFGAKPQRTRNSVEALSPDRAVAPSRDQQRIRSATAAHVVGHLGNKPDVRCRILDPPQERITSTDLGPARQQ